MSIIFSASKIFLVTALIFPISASPQTKETESVLLKNGCNLTMIANNLVEINSNHQLSPVRISPTLRRLVYKASSIVFPSKTSKIIDANEYVLLVINRSSSENPMGCCGAGEEGTLYVLKIKKKSCRQQIFCTIPELLEKQRARNRDRDKIPLFIHYME